MNTSNETSSDKQGATKKNAVQRYFDDLYGDGKLTRIPVKHLYYAENIDHSGSWEHQFSNSECFRPNGAPNGKTRYYVADFVPAWQHFELTVVLGPNTEPITELIPVAFVRRWKRH